MIRISTRASVEMTMQVYTDPRLLDVAGALDLLPALPLEIAAPLAAVRA